MVTRIVLVKATFDEVDDEESDEQNGGDSHTTEMVDIEQTTVHATTPSSENRSTTFEGDFETVDSHKVSMRLVSERMDLIGPTILNSDFS